MHGTMTNGASLSKTLSRGHGCLGGGELCHYKCSGQTPVRDAAEGLLYWLEASVNCLNLHPHLCLPTALYLYFLASGVGPHPGLSLNPTSSMRPPRLLQPQFHIPRHCVDYLEKKKSTHWESLKALVSSKDRGLRPVPSQNTSSTCTQWTQRWDQARKGWRADKAGAAHGYVHTWLQ